MIKHDHTRDCTVDCDTAPLNPVVMETIEQQSDTKAHETNAGGGGGTAAVQQQCTTTRNGNLFTS